MNSKTMTNVEKISGHISDRFKSGLWSDCGSYWVNLNEQGTPGWYEARGGYITASRTAYAAGLSKYKTQDQYAYEFVTGASEIFSDAAKKRMALGVENEPYLRNMYRDLTGFEVAELGLAVSKRDPRLAASPDGMVTDHDGSKGMVEFKYVAQFKPDMVKILGKKTKNLNHIPIEHLCQMQQQMFVLDLPWCDYVVYEYPTMRLFVERIPFDPDFWADIAKRLDYFLDTVVPHVQDNVGHYRTKYRHLYADVPSKK